MAVTNQDIISKIATLETKMDTVQGDIQQIKKDTTNIGLVKSIVFGLVVIIMLAFMGGLVNLILPHTSTQAETLPSTGVQAPGK